MGLLVYGSSLLAPLARANSQTSHGEEYAGADACQGCHQDMYEKFSDSEHKKLLANTDPAKQGCEACHGPGAAHVNSNGDLSKIFRFGQAKALAVRGRCLACHNEFGSKVHSQHEISCLKCHSAHHYAQVKSLLLQGQVRRKLPPLDNSAGQQTSLHRPSI